jgi:hypothetical protein
MPYEIGESTPEELAEEKRDPFRYYEKKAKYFMDRIDEIVKKVPSVSEEFSYLVDNPTESVRRFTIGATNAACYCNEPVGGVYGNLPSMGIVAADLGLAMESLEHLSRFRIKELDSKDRNASADLRIAILQAERSVMAQTFFALTQCCNISKKR